MNLDCGVGYLPQYHGAFAGRLPVPNVAAEQIYLPAFILGYRLARRHCSPNLSFPNFGSQLAEFLFRARSWRHQFAMHIQSHPQTDDDEGNAEQLTHIERQAGFEINLVLFEKLAEKPP